VLEQQQLRVGSQWQTKASTAYGYSSRCRLDTVTQAPGQPEEAVTEHDYL
jgi:hypothetical protein